MAGGGGSPTTCVLLADRGRGGIWYQRLCATYLQSTQTGQQGWNPRVQSPVPPFREPGDKPQGPRPVSFSVLAPSSPSLQTSSAHGPLPCIPRTCSASLTLSWRSIRPMGTRVTSWSGELRLVPRAMEMGGTESRARKPRRKVTSSLPWCLSKVIKNNLNPNWEPFRLSLHSLCSCDVHRPLKVKPQPSKHNLLGKSSLLSETFPTECGKPPPSPPCDKHFSLWDK